MSLERLSDMVELWRRQQEIVATSEGRAARAKAALLRIESEDMPELMRELGVEKVTLLDGTKLTLKEEYACSIPAELRHEAFEWMRENGFGGLIKTTVSLACPDADAAGEMAQRIDDLAEQHELETRSELEETIHPATLKAFANEQLSSGHKLPERLFTLFPITRAKATQPR